MEGGERNETTPPSDGVGNLQQLRMLLALVEQRLLRPPHESADEGTLSLPVMSGGDEGTCRLRVTPDRRRETLSALPYRDRRTSNPGKHHSS